MRNVYYGDYNYMNRLENQRYKRIVRTRQVRRQKMLLCFGIFITILLLTFFSLRAFVYANDKDEFSNYTKQYKSVCVYCGDTIDSISEEYYTHPYKSINQYKKEIRSINHIAMTDNLIPGNYIVIPYYAD